MNKKKQCKIARLMWAAWLAVLGQHGKHPSQHNHLALASKRTRRHHDESYPGIRCLQGPASWETACDVNMDLHSKILLHDNRECAPIYCKVFVGSLASRKMQNIHAPNNPLKILLDPPPAHVVETHPFLQ